jgi:HEAT repeats
MRDTLAPKMRGRGLVVGLLVSALALLGPTLCGGGGEARADEARVKFLAEKLKADDFRVRTNAALALGAVNDELAVEPLCGGLTDGSEVVRQASAVALKRLNRSSSLGCLKSRESVETNDGVKVQITRAIEAIAAGGSGDTGGGGSESIKENPSAKYYVAVSSIANSTGRPQPEVEGIVLKAIKHQLEGASTIQIAPSKETSDAAKEKLSKRKMKGFYLAIALDRFDYSNGNLRVKVKIGVFTYPGKSLIGNVDKALTKEGVSSGDKSSEDQLLDLAASKATEQFAQNASEFL